MESLTRIVERYIAAEMPERFGLILDGWSHAWSISSPLRLLRSRRRHEDPAPLHSTLLNEPDEDLSARGHLNS
ncbi:hypothetical protein GQ600_27825 [Phytophthora cactorum]|nr:hypothetical protein GQ600_27825 [Phytophthora cactorum]